MQVNLDKTKIMVFRNGGPVKQSEKWFFGKDKLEIVTYYKYLGLMISSRLNWSFATKTLSAQSEKAVTGIKCVIIKCGGMSMDNSFELFDKMVVPILIYGSEVWGYQQYSTIERVHYRFCKYLLNVSSNTHNSAVLGECGRQPIFIKCYVKVISYWIKLLHMNVNRLPKCVYTTMLNLDASGKQNWVTHVKDILFRYGFGYAFIWQEIGNSELFIREFKQRLQDSYMQEWSETIHSSSKLKTYCTFKTLLQPEKYLDIIKIKKYRVALTRFRCSNHNLCIETGRREKVLLNDRRCLYCIKEGKSYVEDEYHFISICNLYNNIRTKYIKYAYKCSLFEFCNLLKCTNLTTVCELGVYIYNAFSIREQFLNDNNNVNT